MPTAPELKVIRREFERDIDVLLALENNVVVDNTPPLFFGFSLGQLLTFHGDNNRDLREKLYRVYMKYCPALSQGYLLGWSGVAGELAVAQQQDIRMDGSIVGKNEHFAVNDDVNRGHSSQKKDKRRIGFFSRFFHSHHASGYLLEGLIPLLVKRGYHVTVFVIDDAKYFDDMSLVLSMNAFHQADRGFERDGGHIDSIVFDADKLEGRVNAYPLLSSDYIRNKIRKDASEFVFLPSDMNSCAEAIRGAELSLLVYTELGQDPVSHFLSFARLAPAQALFIGDGDTSGVPSIDYIIVSDNVGLALPDTSYSETVFKMRGLGTVFADNYAEASLLLSKSPRSALLERARFAEMLGLPRAAHLYAVANSLQSLHPKFDDVLVKILSQDRLGYVIILDAANRTTLQRQYLRRLADQSGKLDLESSGGGVFVVEQRVVFYSSVDREKNLYAIAAAHVLLEPLRTSGFLGTLQALALGIPVVSLKDPESRMSGRFGQALYSMMNYSKLVVATTGEYVQTALQLVHNNKLRAEHSQQLFQRRASLFGDAVRVAEDWDNFIGIL